MQENDIIDHNTIQKWITQTGWQYIIWNMPDDFMNRIQDPVLLEKLTKCRSAARELQYYIDIQQMTTPKQA